MSAARHHVPVRTEARKLAIKDRRLNRKAAFGPALAEALKLDDRTQTDVELICNVDRSTVSDWLNPSVDAWPNFAHAILAAESGELPNVVRVLRDALEPAVVRAVKPRRVPAPKLLSKLVKESSDVTCSMSAHLADGHYSAAEKRDDARELSDLLVAGSKVRAQLLAEAEGGDEAQLELAIEIDRRGGAA